MHVAHAEFRSSLVKACESAEKLSELRRDCALEILLWTTQFLLPQRWAHGNPLGPQILELGDIVSTSDHLAARQSGYPAPLALKPTP